MSTTNKPILLDETGREMLTKMDVMNAYLSLIAGGQRNQTYNSVSEMASIIRGNTLEQNKLLFPVGDQFVIPWKNMGDPNHNTDETAYQVVTDIVHHGMVELETGETVPGMFCQWHHCTPLGVQFGHQQAFLNCPDGLAAGTYIVGLGSNWGANAVGGTRWAFTLTQAVPVGGRLSGFEGMPDIATSSWKVKSWATPADENPIETVTVTQATGNTAGIDLGVMPYTNPDETTGLNSMQRVAYGHNRWKTSAIRQYLNASGAGWWTSQEDFDIRPNQHKNNAFMDGFNSDLLNATRPIKLVTALNTVDGYTETYDVTYDRFFLPSLEQMYITPQINGEGEFWEYWRERLGASSPITTGTKYPNMIVTGIDNTNNEQSIRFRSANRDHSSHTWIVYKSGIASSNYASDPNRLCPVFVIC